MKIGDLEILPVMDGEMKVPGTAVFPRSEKEWEPHRKLLDEAGMLTLSLGGFLIRGVPGDRVILVDAGLGDYEMGGRKLGGKLLASLASHGVSPGDVTDVMFSHLHLDHVGWASQGGQPVFPNATYRCDQRDWDYWIVGAVEDIRGVPVEFAVQQREALAPIANRLEAWDTDVSLFSGVSVLNAPGHTPGSAIVVLSAGSERAVLLGDAVHCPVELLEEEWTGLGDVDPELARRTRNAQARELEGTDTWISAAHFPGLEFGRLLRAEGRRWWSQ